MLSFVDAPDSTLNLADAHPDPFPFSDPLWTVESMRPRANAADLRTKFAALDFDENERLSDLCPCFLIL
jgi:hypothetical protein